jgi:hypothetical protein
VKIDDVAHLDLATPPSFVPSRLVDLDDVQRLAPELRDDLSRSARRSSRA